MLSSLQLIFLLPLSLCIPYSSVVISLLWYLFRSSILCYPFIQGVYYKWSLYGIHCKVIDRSIWIDAYTGNNSMQNLLLDVILWYSVLFIKQYLYPGPVLWCWSPKKLSPATFMTLPPFAVIVFTHLFLIQLANSMSHCFSIFLVGVQLHKASAPLFPSTLSLKMSK